MNINGHYKNRSISLNEKSLERQQLKYNIYPKAIGAGSFATVYRGIDKNGIDVAIKRIKITSVCKKMLDKFLFELHIGTILKNKNIVECIETFKTERHWYIVSEYCDAGTFQDIITLVKNNNNIDEKENISKKYLSQLKDAIQYLRNLNIIHRDLKPQNILLKNMIIDGEKQMVVKLADFGFARYFNQHAQNDNGNDDMVNTICGSPIYMAPELLINGKYNMKADLWSFGVIMYETLFGFCPYNYPKNINQLCDRITNQKINYPINYSNECIDLIKSLLTIEPEKRINWDDFFEHEWFKGDKYNKINTIDNEDCFFNMDNDIKETYEEEHKYIDDVLKHNDTKNINKNYNLIIEQQNNINKLQKLDDFIIIEHDDVDVNEIDKQYQSQISFTGSVINIIGSSINMLKSLPRSI